MSRNDYCVCRTEYFVTCDCACVPLVQVCEGKVWGRVVPVRAMKAYERVGEWRCGSAYSWACHWMVINSHISCHASGSFLGWSSHLISINLTSVYLIFLDFMSKSHVIKGHLQTFSSFKIDVFLDVRLCQWASSYHWFVMIIVPSSSR